MTMQTRMSERKRRDSLNDRNPVRYRYAASAAVAFPPAPVRCKGNRRKLQGIARASLFGGQFGAAARFMATLKAEADKGATFIPATVPPPAEFVQAPAENLPATVQAPRPDWATKEAERVGMPDPTLGTGIDPANLPAEFQAPVKFACVQCGAEFDTKRGVAAHKGRAHKSN